LNKLILETVASCGFRGSGFKGSEVQGSRVQRFRVLGSRVLGSKAQGLRAKKGVEHIEEFGSRNAEVGKR
jgi:hypothetical protein